MMPKSKRVIDGWELSDSQLLILGVLSRHKTGLKVWDVHLIGRIPLTTSYVGLRELGVRGLVLESRHYYRVAPKLRKEVEKILSKLKTVKTVSSGVYDA